VHRALRAPAAHAGAANAANWQVGKIRLRPVVKMALPAPPVQ